MREFKKRQAQSYSNECKNPKQHGNSSTYFNVIGSCWYSSVIYASTFIYIHNLCTCTEKLPRDVYTRQDFEKFKDKRRFCQMNAWNESSCHLLSKTPLELFKTLAAFSFKLSIRMWWHTHASTKLLLTAGEVKMQAMKGNRQDKRMMSDRYFTGTMKPEITSLASTILITNSRWDGENRAIFVHKQLVSAL